VDNHSKLRGGEAPSSEVSFRQFLWIWNRCQGQTTPPLHMEIAGWLYRRWQQGDQRLVLLVFRSAGKSTLVGVFCAWMLLQQPDLRILVLAAEHDLARKMVRNVKRIIERHPLTRVLVPRRLDQWAADQFTVRRRLTQRDPSLLARGIAANITGSRADVVICDDVEVPNTCATPSKRAELRQRLREIEYVLVPGGLQLYVGTPHSYSRSTSTRHARRLAKRRHFWPTIDGSAFHCSMLAARVAGPSVSRWRRSSRSGDGPDPPSSRAR
jgi:hypothetical protein